MLAILPHTDPYDMTGINPLMPTVFHEPWWLDIVTEGKYKVAEVSDNGTILGRLPYFIGTETGITKGMMPPLTHFLGPAVVEGEGNADTKFMNRLEIIRELVGQLPPLASFYIKCHRGVTDVIAFQMERFKTTIQFTHEIYPAPVDVLWKNMQHKKRSIITRAQKRVTCGYIEDPSEFVRFFQENLSAKGRANEWNPEICKKIVAEALKRNRGRVFCARDKGDNLVAAVFCVWDKVSSYYLLTTRREDSHFGVISLLIWEAMQHAAKAGLIFDLDGISSDGGVAFYSGFGATIAPRYIASRESAFLRVLRDIRGLFRKENFYC